MVLQVVVAPAQAQDSSHLGYFFQTGGAIKFSDADSKAPGYACCVVAADHYGIVVYSDLSSVYVAHTNKLLAAASKELKSPEVLDPATVCIAALAMPGVTALSLSADQLLLGCVAGSTVQVYSLPKLLHHQSDGPVHTLELGKKILQFSWCPNDVTTYLALTFDRVLVQGSLPVGFGPLADSVECACWSPDGQFVAYSSGNKLLVTAPDWRESAFTVAISPAEDEDGDGNFIVDSITWPAPNAIAASSLWHDSSNEDEPEGSDGYLLGITWTSWEGQPTAAPQGLKAMLTSYLTIQTLDEDPGCGTHEWPYLQHAYVPGWQLLVHGHRKSCDDHIRLMTFNDDEATALDQGETKLVAAVPTVDAGENFIVGMAVDFSDQESIPHPMDQEKPDVPASCILLVATLDGVLRLYRLANFQQLDAGLARQPAAVPDSLPPAFTTALAAAKVAQQVDEVAFNQRHQQQQQQPKSEEAAAAVALPSDDFDELDEDIEQQQQQQQQMPDGAGSDNDSTSAVGRPMGVSAGDAGSGWGSSEDEEDEGSDEVASRPTQGDTDSATAESSVATSKAKLAASASASAVAPTSAQSLFGSVASASSGSSLFSSLGAFKPPAQQQPSIAPAAFGAAGSQPAFSFSQLGSGTSSSTAGSISSSAAPFSCLGAFDRFGTSVASLGAESAAPAFGAASTTPTLEAASSTSAFGLVSTTPAFGAAASAPAFGDFGVSAPAFGALSTLALGAASSQPAFGTSVAPAADKAAAAPAASDAAAAAASDAAAAAPKAVTATSAPAALGPFAGSSLQAAATSVASAAASGPSAGLSLDQLSSSSSVFGGALSGAAANGAAPSGTNKGPFTLPVEAFKQAAATAAVPVDQFQSSPVWQAPRPGFIFTTGQHGTGYYKDTPPQVPVAKQVPAAPSPAADRASGKPASKQVAVPTTIPIAPSSKTAGFGTSTPVPAGSKTFASLTSSDMSAASRAGPATTARQLAAKQQQQASNDKAGQLQAPQVKVTARRAQLADQGQEVAEAEVTFLQSLQAVAQMRAELQQLISNVVPKEVNCWELVQQTQQLRKEAAGVAQTFKQQKQAASKLVDSWDEANRQTAALAMFHPKTAGTAVIEKELPLEPALAGLRDGIQDTFEAINSNMEDLEQQLEHWQQQMGPAGTATTQQQQPTGMVFGKPLVSLAAPKPFQASGSNKSSSPWGSRTKVAAGSVSSGVNFANATAGAIGCAKNPQAAQPASINAQIELLYKVVKAQNDTAANLTAHINSLAQQLEVMGIIKTDTEHLGSKALGRWGEELDAGSDSGYGSAMGGDENEYERESANIPSATATAAAACQTYTPVDIRRGPSSLPSAATAAAADKGSAVSGGHSLFGGSSIYQAPSPVLGTPGSGQCQLSGVAATRMLNGRSRGRQQQQQLHWVTPGSSGAKSRSASRLQGNSNFSTPADTTSTRQRVGPLASGGSTTSSSSAAWQKLANELSRGSSAGGSRQRRLRVRTTVATPWPRGSSSRGRPAAVRHEPGEGVFYEEVVSPPRPPSPLQISAAAAAAPAAASGAVPSAAFTFPGQLSGPGFGQQSGKAASTFPSNKEASKLSFATPDTAARKAAFAVHPALGQAAGGAFTMFGASPGAPATPATGDKGTGIPAAAGAAAGTPRESALNFNNPLYDKSPGVSPSAGLFSPVAAVPSPALKMGVGQSKPGGAAGSTASDAAAPPAPAAAKPAISKPKSNQPPDPPMAALQQAAALEKQVLRRQSSEGSTASSSATVSAAAAASTAKSAAVKPSPVQSQSQSATPAMRQSDAAKAAGAAAASRAAAVEVATAPAAGSKPAAKPMAASSQPPEPPAALTQQAAAALQRFVPAGASKQGAAETAKPPPAAAAPANKASRQPPEPPSDLLQAAAQAGSQLIKQAAAVESSQEKKSAATPAAPVSAPAAASSAAAPAAASSPSISGASTTPGTTGFGAFSFNTGAASTSGASLLFGTASSAASGAASSSPLFGTPNDASAGAISSASTGTSNSADTLNLMLDSSAAGFAGFGALGFGGGVTATAASPPAGSAAPAFDFSTAASIVGTASTAAGNIFGSSGAGNISSPFGSLLSLGGTGSSTGAVFGSSTGVSTGSAFGGFGAVTARSSGEASSSSPFGALLYGAGSGAAASAPFVFGTPVATPAAATLPFGTPPTASQPASSAFGASSSSVFSASSTAAATAAPFGQSSAFSSGFSAPAFGAATTSAAAVGVATTSSSSSPFGTPTPSSAASGAGSVFGGFGTPAPFGQQQQPAAAASSGTTSAFGGSSVFGQQPAQPASPFGQPSGFGQPLGFGQPATFGHAASPASPFGTPAAFGTPATPAAPFGQSSAYSQSGDFRAAAGSPGSGGFNAFAASAPQQSNPGSAGSGFAAFAGASNTGFGALAAGTGGGIGAAAGGFGTPSVSLFRMPSPSQQQQSSMWGGPRR